MNRRRFLQGAAALAATFAIDPERMLYVPGAKKIFIPNAKVELYTPLDMSLAAANFVAFSQLAYGWENSDYWQLKADEQLKIVKAARRVL